MSNALPQDAPLVHKPGRLSRRTSRLAFGLTLPGIVVVLGVVLLPLLTTFWISSKSIGLEDLSPPRTQISDRLRGELTEPGDEATYRLTIRIPQNQGLLFRDFGFTAVWPAQLEPLSLDDRCTLSSDDPNGRQIDCSFGDIDLDERFSERIEIPVRALDGFDPQVFNAHQANIVPRGSAPNPIFAEAFTRDNFALAATTRNFWRILGTTFAYTFFSTLGAIVVGLFAALLLNQPFRGRSVFRGFLLFPYVAPVIAVALTWVALLNPTSGSLNELFVQMGALDRPFNFFGKASQTFELFGLEMSFPVALTSVIVFEIWRYFPLAFLFILARMQSVPQDMYEAATMDGASPFQQFFALSLPMLFGIMSVLFLLRFIWTFNKFEDIFLLTGGGSGTQTMTIEVYRWFSIDNFGAASAVAVLIFAILSVFAALYFWMSPKEEGL